MSLWRFVAIFFTLCLCANLALGQSVVEIKPTFNSMDTVLNFIRHSSLNAFNIECAVNDGNVPCNIPESAAYSEWSPANGAYNSNQVFLFNHMSALGVQDAMGMGGLKGGFNKMFGMNPAAWVFPPMYSPSINPWTLSHDYHIGGAVINSSYTYSLPQALQQTNNLKTVINEVSGTPVDRLNIAYERFQFVSGGTYFDLNYVFASDEYDTSYSHNNPLGYQFAPYYAFGHFGASATWGDTIYHTNSGLRIMGPFNDGMAIMLSGPGISGSYLNNAENIAIIPGTNDPVTVRTVRPNFNTGLPWDTACNAGYFNWGSSNYSPFDGYTDVLPVKKIPINPCDTYTLELMVCQAGNHHPGQSEPFNRSLSLGGSALIVEKHSARTGFWYPAPLKLYDGLGKDTIAEGCPGMLLKLVRFTNINQPDSIHLVYEGDAQYGIDYDSLPEWVYFTPGQDTTSFVITPTEDFSAEAIENLVIRLMPPGEFPCPVDTTEVELWISDRPGLTASIPDTFFFNPCETDSIVIGPDSISGLEDFSFLWSSGATSRYDTVAPVNNQNYALTVYDACMYDSIVVTTVLRQAPDPEFALVNNDSTISCNDSLLPIGFEVTANFYPQFHYLWSTGDTDSIAWVNPLVNGAHIYTVTVYRPCMPDSFLLNLTVNVENDPVVVDIDDIDPAHCPGHSYTLSPAVSGGYPPYAFVWSTGQTTSGINVAPFVTTEYILSVTDSCALDTVVEPVTVNVPVFDSLEIIGKRQITFPCDVGYLNIAAGEYRGRGGTGASGADQSHYTFSWNNWLSTQKSLKLDVFADTTLTLQMTDTCMLDTAVLHIPVDVFDGPFLSASLPDTLHACIGEAFSFAPNVSHGVKPYRYQWQNGSTDSLFSYTPELAKRAFAVTVSDYCGYSEQEKVTVYATRPIADFRAVNDSHEPRIIQFENESEDAISYRWFFGDGAESTEEQPVYSYQDLKEWEVTLIATDTFGCDDELTKALDIPLNLFIPNAFTPDGDGNNEVWQPLGYGFKTLGYTIFDRWGNAIFEVKETSDTIRPWDGTASGTPVPVGTYTYLIIVDPYKGLKEEIMGEVTVVR